MSQSPYQPLLSDQASAPTPANDEGNEGQQSPPMGNEEQTLKSEYRNGDAAAWYAAVGSVSLIAITSISVVLSNEPFNLSYFAFHMPFNTLAILVFTLSIVQLQPTAQPRTKQVGLERHQLGMFIGLPLIALGTSAMILNKSLHGAAHFTTWHGTFGIACVTWLVVQFLFGGLTVWRGGAALGGGMKAKRLWKYHRLSGYVLLPALLLTVHFAGAYATWMDDGRVPSFVRFIVYTLAPLVAVGAAYLRVRPSKLGFM